MTDRDLLNDIKQDIRTLFGKVDGVKDDIARIRVNCAGRCGLAREIGRVVVAAVTAVASALGVTWARGH